MLIDNEEFQYWLFRMDDTLIEFNNFMRIEYRIELDYSEKSLLDLEDWLISNFPSHLEILKFDKKTLLDACSRYLGEHIRKFTNLKWECDFSNPDAAHYGIPSLNTKDHYVPRQTVTTACSRRRGDLIKNSANRVIGGNNI